jgi:hypothetical protein
LSKDEWVLKLIKEKYYRVRSKRSMRSTRSMRRKEKRREEKRKEKE